MDDQPITHESGPKELLSEDKVLETTDKNGIKCIWSGSVIDHRNSREVRFSWKFDWQDLKTTGIDGLSGRIMLTTPHGPRTIEVDLTVNSQVIETSISNFTSDNCYAIFEYHLIPYCLPIQKEALYDEMFLPSKLTDTILVIDEKRLHVNRAFLSYHSEFFRALFSSKFKEGQMARAGGIDTGAKQL